MTADKQDKYSVLIVDDEEMMRETVRDFLELHDDFNYLIVEAKDGADAIHKANSQKFDLVITDLNMPHKNGKELITELRVFPKELRPKKFMVISGSVEKDVMKEGRSGISILKKPFDMEKFHKYVEISLLGKKNVSAKASPSVNVEYLNPFIDATLEVLDVMASVKSEKDFIFIKEDNEVLGDITGLIPIKGEGHMGSFAISFSESTFLAIVSNMLGEEYTEINDENKDGVAEICNQIYGNAKATLSSMGYSLDLTTPKIIMGGSEELNHLVKGTVLAVYFNTDFGKFVVEAIIQET